MSNTKSAESTLSEPIFNRQALVRLILPLLAEQFLSVSMGMADMQKVLLSCHPLVTPRCRI